MGKMLPPDQLALYEKVDELLWTEWDPIGVNDIPEARDEYYRYLPTIFKLAMDDADEYKISKYLLEFERSSMGMSGNEVNCKRVARMVLNAKQVLIES